ncbi:hypothetical protein CCH79_00018776, partial [Gambusia affinis]
MIKVSNENGGLITLWNYTLTSVEKKYPQEEKDLAVLECAKRLANILLDPELKIGPAQPTNKKRFPEKWDSTTTGREVPEEYVDKVVQSVHTALGQGSPTRCLWAPGCLRGKF